MTFFFDGACRGNGGAKAAGGAGAHLDRIGEDGSRKTIWADSCGLQYGCNSATKVTKDTAELRGVEMVANRLAHLAMLDRKDPERAQALGGVGKVFVAGDSEMDSGIWWGERAARHPTLAAIVRRVQRTFRQAERSLKIEVVYISGFLGI